MWWTNERGACSWLGDPHLATRSVSLSPFRGGSRVGVPSLRVQRCRGKTPKKLEWKKGYIFKIYSIISSIVSGNFTPSPLHPQHRAARVHAAEPPRCLGGTYSVGPMVTPPQQTQTQ